MHGIHRMIKTLAGLSSCPRPVKMDPIHQFELKPLVSFGHIGHQNIAFTQSALYRPCRSRPLVYRCRGLVPPRCQSVQADARHPPDDQGGLIVLLVLGFAAGIYNVMRVSGFFPVADTKKGLPRRRSQPQPRRPPARTPATNSVDSRMATPMDEGWAGEGWYR
jgi:hypothetical protein